MEVLVLGHKGMLGHMIVKYLLDNNIKVITTNVRWPENKDFLLNFNGDFIINCIGAIPQRTNNFDINWMLPIWLDLNAPCRIIHPGTDCEMDDDNYGISKRIAADYIKEHGKQTKSIKTSIIGPEYKTHASLLEWFLNCKELSVNGYSNAIWNGNTTLEWSKQCVAMMNNWKEYNKETIISSKKVSKYELLLLIKTIFNKKIKVEAYPEGTDKSLKDEILTKNIEEQLKELKGYYYE